MILLSRLLSEISVQKINPCKHRLCCRRFLSDFYIASCTDLKWSFISNLNSTLHFQSPLKTVGCFLLLQIMALVFSLLMYCQIRCAEKDLDWLCSSHLTTTSSWWRAGQIAQTDSGAIAHGLTFEGGSSISLLTPIVVRNIWQEHKTQCMQ